jgi:hypothetical protein
MYEVATRAHCICNKNATTDNKLTTRHRSRMLTACPSNLLNEADSRTIPIKTLSTMINMRSISIMRTRCIDMSMI